jgi:RNA polymerase sigma-70 factor (ECF subfamily)
MEIRSDLSRLDAASFSMAWLPARRKGVDNDPETVALLERAVGGDPAAFEQILIRHERRVLTLAWRLLGTMEDAEDAAQEVFLRAFRYLHRFDPRRPITPWLARMTVNVARDLRRKRQRVRMVSAELPDEDLLSIGTQEPTPYSNLAMDERRQMLWHALSRLPEKEQAAIVLRDLEGFSTREVAEVLESSETTVRSQISSARLKLRKMIGRMKGGVRS